jgi:hypothetical protein
MSDNKAITDALAAPFDPAEVKFKPAAVSGNRALALCYVDARVVQDRLDSVLGVGGWQDEYTVMPDGQVVCKLQVRLEPGGPWITKTDVGGQSEQPDDGDKMKAAFSDALKRAAVKFGVGRYLYRAPQQWCDYDPKSRKFTKQPTLPPAPTGKAAGAKEEPVATITEAQAKEIVKLLREHNILTTDGKAYATGIFETFKVDRLGALPADKYDRLVAAIKVRNKYLLPA